MALATPSDTVLGDLRILLPEGWWTVHLHPEAVRVRAVDRLIERQFAGVDDQPLLKADTRKHLLDTAADAARTYGQLMAISLMRAQGIPIPATMVLYWIELGPRLPGPEDAGPVRHLDDVADMLMSAAEPGGSADRLADASFDRATVAAGEVIRRVREQDGPKHLNAAELRTVIADYWVEFPDGTGLVQLTFSTPLITLKDPLLELFDTVVSSASWVSEGDRGD